MNIKKFFKFIPLLCTVSFCNCTDLDETYYDQVDPNGVPTSVLISSIYSSLKGDYSASPRYCPFWLYLYDVQVSTDELAMPVCGQQKNWYDKGIYLQMQNHTWTPDNVIFESCWSYCYKIISTCNGMLAEKDRFKLDGQSVAECRLLRSYGYYRLMDLFGNVPVLKEDNAGESPKNSSRKEVFEFIESELNDTVMNCLKQKRFAKMDKGVLHTLKARLYLNSKVFLGLEDGSDEYNAYLEKCIAECDSVINSGQYSIAPNIYSNFYYDNGPTSSKENIFVIEYNNDGTTLGNRTQMTSYYKTQNLTFGGDMYQHTTGGYKVNPGKTADDPEATFNIFEKNDNRRLSMLWGTQYNVFTGKPVDCGISSRIFDDNGKIVYDTINYRPFFTRGMGLNTMDNLKNVARNGDGARIIKFELEKEPGNYESGVDMVVMRYAEVLYMKAECLIRLGRNAEAVPLFKEVLQHRGFDYANMLEDAQNAITLYYPEKPVTYDFEKDEPKDATWPQAMMSKRWLTPEDIETYIPGFIPANPDLEFMDQELRREFIFEDHRRTDMIRMNKFIEGTWGGHLEATNDPNKLVFPIPTTVLGQNPNLVQNPGY